MSTLRRARSGDQGTPKYPGYPQTSSHCQAQAQDQTRRMELRDFDNNPQVKPTSNLPPTFNLATLRLSNSFPAKDLSTTASS